MLEQNAVRPGGLGSIVHAFAHADVAALTELLGGDPAAARAAVDRLAPMLV